jgi:hypothetical protein
MTRDGRPKKNALRLSADIRAETATSARSQRPTETAAAVAYAITAA